MNINSGVRKTNLKIPSDELAILNRIIENPMITQAELSEQTGKYLRTIKREMT